ncbi:hydantoinase B/oxoprolinase family protein [Salinisphaera sp. T31B1]|uniref:hydantoinase B/oxoprolinase family protein n=1 Tax=Salinisphaera sp. T31B1 TaxID=727963 RepID=UPI0033429200
MNMTDTHKIDPIDMEVVGHTMISIADEMAITLQRTAYSSIVREAKDFSTALFNAHGDLLAQSESIPTHLGSMGKTLKRVLADYIPAHEIAPGDQIVLNHPYLGASHTPDILLYAPVFVDDRLIAFSATMCHHVDVGGVVAGSAPSNATELFQEGLLIPPLKLYEKGEENRAITEIIRANVRMPDYTLGDLRSQISANAIGVRRLSRLLDRYGADTVIRIMNAWMDYSQDKIRTRLAELPDGTGRATGHLDDDGVDIGQRIDLPVEISIAGDRIHFDFTGVARQVRGPFNVSPETVWSVAYYITRCLTGGQAVQNEGVFRQVDVTLAEGTILNPRFPAPVSGRYHTIMRLSDICFQACSQLLPDRIPASSHAHATTLAIGGRKPDDGQYFVYYELNGGGMGARPGKDGLSGIDVYVGNCMNVPVESAEQEYPLRFTQYELYENSGGLGEYRGGLGIVREVELLADELTVTLRNDGETTHPAGAQGGCDGLPAHKMINRGRADETRIQGKVTARPMCRGDRIAMYTAGSGGYGDPARRHPAAAAADRDDGYISG